MLEHAEVFGNLYAARAGRSNRRCWPGDTLFDVDWQGGQQIRHRPLGRMSCRSFVLPPSLPELERRLRGRGQDSDAVICRAHAEKPVRISHWAEYDYSWSTTTLDQTEARCVPS